MTLLRELVFSAAIRDENYLANARKMRGYDPHEKQASSLIKKMSRRNFNCNNTF